MYAGKCIIERNEIMNFYNVVKWSRISVIIMWLFIAVNSSFYGLFMDVTPYQSFSKELMMFSMALADVVD